MFVGVQWCVQGGVRNMYIISGNAQKKGEQWLLCRQSGADTPQTSLTTSPLLCPCSDRPDGLDWLICWWWWLTLQLNDLVYKRPPLDPPLTQPNPVQSLLPFVLISLSFQNLGLPLKYCTSTISCLTTDTRTAVSFNVICHNGMNCTKTFLVYACYIPVCLVFHETWSPYNGSPFMDKDRLETFSKDPLLEEMENYTVWTETS
jgi:hypothetical protein